MRQQLRRLQIGLTMGLATLFVGCTSAPLQPGAAPAPASQVVDMPPQQLLADVKRIVSAPPINLGATDEGNGVILTGYERHRGDWHIGRYWQEQTRYRIAIIPDWNNPTVKSRIEITAQTEERAAEGQKWEPNPASYHPERAEALLSKIMSQLKAP